MGDEDYGSGAYSGLQEVYMGASIGSERLMSDLGSMMPTIAPPRMHPYQQVRHGMYAHEMSFVGSVGALMGGDVPKTMTAYEYQELAARDLGQRVGSAVVMGGLYATGAAAGWVGAEAAMKGSYSLGKKIFNVSTKTFSLGKLGAGLMGATGLLTAALAVDYAVGEIAEDVKDRQDIMNYLEASSFRYATGSGKDIDERFGAGFNRKAQAKIAGTIKNIELGDSSLNMGDMKQILEGGTQLGLFTGARDAEEFGTKFKELTETVKKVTQTLHTTLVEGLKTIKSLKEQGYTSALDISGAVMTADILGTASGRTAAEMLSIGSQGAAMVRGTGISLATGSNMAMQISASITGLQQGGMLSQEMIAQAGGAGALGQQIMARDINYARSDIGRGMMFGMLGAGGRLDLSRFDQMASGELSTFEALANAQGNLSSGGIAGFIQASVNQGENLRTMAAQFGGQGLRLNSMGSRIRRMRDLRDMVPNLEGEIAYKFAAQQQGLSESEIAEEWAMMENSKVMREDRMAAAGITARKSTYELLRAREDERGYLSDLAARTFSAAGGKLSGGMEAISESVTETAREWKKEWRADVNRRFLGIDSTETRDISQKRLRTILLEGAEYEGFSDEELKYKKDILSRRVLEGFSETAAYKRLDKEFGINVGAAAGDVFRLYPTFDGKDDLERFAQDVTGKSWDELDREKRLYVATVAERQGMGAVVKEIKTRSKAAQVALYNRRFSSQATANTALEVSQKGMLSLLKGELGGLYLVGDRGDVGDLFKTREGKAAMFGLIEAKIGGKASEINKATRNFRIVAGKSEVSRTDINEIIERVSKMDEGTLEDFSRRKEALGKAQMGAELLQVETSAKTNLENLDISGLEGKERARFKRGMAGVITAIFDEDRQVTAKELEQVGGLAGKVDPRLARMISIAQKIETEGGLNIEDTKALMGKGFSEEQLRSLMGPDDMLSATEFLRFKGIENFSVKQKLNLTNVGKRGEGLDQMIETLGGITRSTATIYDIEKKLAILWDSVQKK